jgi:SAM-dependent methyltransferase
MGEKVKLSEDVIASPPQMGELWAEYMKTHTPEPKPSKKKLLLEKIKKILKSWRVEKMVLIPDPEFKFVVDFVKGWKPAKTLEIGCNFGRELKSIETLTHVFGVDGDQEKIKQARVNVPSGVFKVASADKIPFSNGFFDLVYSDGCLSHNPPEQALKIIDEMMRVGKRIFIVEYQGTKMSASGFSNCKTGVWIHDFPMLFAMRNHTVLVSKEVQVGLDLFRVMVIARANPSLWRRFKLPFF